MSKQGGIKDIALGRSDLYRMEPSALHLKEGWNSRDKDFDPTDDADLALARSIAEVGVKQPLTVYWEDGKAFLEDGHRRLAATLYAIRELGAEVKTVPVQTGDRYANEGDRVMSQIVRNSGKPLTPFEQGKVFKRLIDLGWTEKEIAAKAGRTVVWIKELLNLQAMPEEAKELVRSGAVSASLASTVVKDAGGDGQAVTKKLRDAVDTARAAGKDRATAKHVADRQPSLKARLREWYDGVTVSESNGSFVMEMTADEYATIRSLAGA